MNKLTEELLLKAFDELRERVLQSFRDGVKVSLQTDSHYHPYKDFAGDGYATGETFIVATGETPAISYKNI